MNPVAVHRTRLGRTNLMVSAFGIGTWSAAGVAARDGLALGWGGGDEEAALETLSMAFAYGVNFVDTSPTYGFGQSEILLGEALRTAKGHVHVATKGGRIWDNHAWRNDLSRDSLFRSCAASLGRLGLAQVDLFLLKDPTVGEVDDARALDTLQELKSRGFARWVGISTHKPSVAEELIATDVIDFVEIEHHVLKPVAQVVFDCARRHDVGLAAVSPLYFGWLSGRYAGPESFPDDDWRSRVFRGWSRPHLDCLAHCVDTVCGIARARGSSPAQVALQYVLQSSQFATVVTGARRVAQLKESLSVLSQAPLTAVEFDALLGLELPFLRMD